MFDTLVRLTAALKLRILGMLEDDETVDALPITLMTHAGTDADDDALLCDCEEQQVAFLNDDKSSSSYMPPYKDNEADADEMQHAPAVSTGNTGHTLWSLPAGYAILFVLLIKTVMEWKIPQRVL